jgi:hypothetical protein
MFDFAITGRVYELKRLYHPWQERALLLLIFQVTSDWLTVDA